MDTTPKTTYNIAPLTSVAFLTDVKDLFYIGFTKTDVEVVFRHQLEFKTDVFTTF